MSEALRVRIKPLNKRTGCVTRTYMIGGIRFREEDGWYAVPAETVERLRLREKPQQQSEPFGQLLFDVCTLEEAKYLDNQARMQKLRATAVAPNTIRGADGAPRRVHNAGLDGVEPAPLVQGAAVSQPDTTLTTSDLNAPAEKVGSPEAPREIIQHHTEPAHEDEAEPEAVIVPPEPEGKPPAPAPRRASPPRRRSRKS